MKLEVHGDISGTRVHVGTIESAGGVELNTCNEVFFSSSAHLSERKRFLGRDYPNIDTSTHQSDENEDLFPATE